MCADEDNLVVWRQTFLQLELYSLSEFAPWVKIACVCSDLNENPGNSYHKNPMEFSLFRVTSSIAN